MCYQICNILRVVRQVQRSQIRFIPLAFRLLIFLVYLFFGLLYVFPLAVQSRASLCPSPISRTTILSHLQDRHYVHIGSAHVCPRHIYLYMCVRMKPLIRKSAACDFFMLIRANHVVGIAFFIVFGSQRDVLRVWCFWRKDETTMRSTTTDSGTLTIEDPVITKLFRVR